MIYSSVDCQEIKNTATEDWQLTSIGCSVQLNVSAANKDALIQDLILNARVWPHLSGMLQPPIAYQCTAVANTSNSPVSGQAYTWDDYNVTVKYTTAPDRQLFSESIEPSAEFLRLDHRYFRWASGAPLTDAEAPGLMMRTLNIVRTYMNQPSVPPEILTGVGKVHNASYSSAYLGLTFAAETLLYCPSPVTRSVSTLTTTGYQYTAKFAYRPWTWNKYFRPSTNAFESIYNLAGSVVKPYPPANLSALLI